MAGNRGQKIVPVTRKGNPSGAASGQPMQGDTQFGVGSSYSATLVERENKSINRNNSVTHPTANDGTLPMVAAGQRNTGKI